MTCVVDGHAVYCICTKNIDNYRKDEELTRLLRSYDKQNSINAMKKNGAPLLGLAKYIYYPVSCVFLLLTWGFLLPICYFRELLKYTRESMGYCRAGSDNSLVN